MNIRVVKAVVFTFVLSCVVFSGPAWGIEIQPSNFLMPTAPGTPFSFDFVISDPMGVSATAFKSTINVSGPGVLTFDASGSTNVENDIAYWIFNNSVGAAALDKGGDNYEFGDGPDTTPFEALVLGDIVARYAFLWDGTVDDYTFTLDLDTSKSFVLLDDFSTKQTLELPDGTWYSEPITTADSTSFTVYIPEPATLLLFGLGTMILRKRWG